MITRLIRSKKWLAGGCFSVLSAFSQAAIVYEQPLLVPAAGNYGFVSNFSNSETADNFTLTDTYQLDSITWYGTYFDPSGFYDASSPAGVPDDQFGISILDLSSNVIVDIQAGGSEVRTATGDLDFFGAMIFQYTLDFVPFMLTAGEYLLSITDANINAIDWYWSDGTNGDSIVYQRSFAPQTFAGDQFPVDTAFTLMGSEVIDGEVSSPASLVLLSCGLLVLAGLRRART